MPSEMEIESPMRQMGYDRAIAVFSPEGRMYQVEYARKAVEKATTIVAVVFSNGVVLVAAKMLQKLMVPDSVEKISKIDDHIVIASCGILADARTLVDFARVKAQVNKITFGEPIEIYTMAKDIADRVQRFTQVGGIRPYGVGMLIAGVDGSPRLFETDPSGTMREWLAHSIGRGSKESRKILIEEYREGMAKDKAIELALKALKVGEKKLTSKNTELVVVEKAKGMKAYNRIELKELLKKFD